MYRAKSKVHPREGYKCNRQEGPEGNRSKPHFEGKLASDRGVCTAKVSSLCRLNLKLAKAIWGAISKVSLKSLLDISIKHHLSIAAGDLHFLDGRWYITHSGLLQIATRRRCRGIQTKLQQKASDATVGRWVFKAIVYKSASSIGFVGYGDADPSNTSPLIRGAEMRVAETRAVNRALRKAYGIGICSVEELGAPSSSQGCERTTKPQAANGQPRLKDKLCLVIRQHNLDPALVKAYAAHFCGTETLSGASRELVESFIAHLEKEVREDRDGLLCKLNSFSQPVEVHS